MRIAEGQEADRSQFTSDARELSDLLDEWDFIGVYEREDPSPFPGEYADLVFPILKTLRTSAGRQSLPRELKDVIHADYGLDVDDAAAFAGRVTAWWMDKH